MTAYHSHLPWRKRPTALFLPPPIVHRRYKLGKEIGHGGLPVCTMPGIFATEHQWYSNEHI